MLSDSIRKRIAELSAHQAEIQARADLDKAKVQTQINALTDALDAIVKDPTIEPVFLQLVSLNLLPKD